MTLCLNNVSGLKQKRKDGSGGGRVRLVDAAWVWTEPHSMRLKVRVVYCAILLRTVGRLCLC
jgi:nonsense-mediated mRNA decay protein 3